MSRVSGSREIWDDDDFQYVHRKPPPSGTVTGLGVVTIIYASLSLFCGGISGLFAFGIFLGNQGQVPLLPRAFIMGFGVTAVVVAIAYLLTCVGGIIGGICLLNRSAIGRWLTIGVGGIQGLFAIGFGLVLAYKFMDDGNDRGGIPLFCFALLIHGGFWIYAWWILLFSSHKEEFH